MAPTDSQMAVLLMKFEKIGLWKRTWDKIKWSGIDVDSFIQDLNNDSRSKNLMIRAAICEAEKQTSYAILSLNITEGDYVKAALKKRIDAVKLVYNKVRNGTVLTPAQLEYRRSKLWAYRRGDLQKWGESEQQNQALTIFQSIHDLISLHDDGLRWDPEVYAHVRTCFDMIYEHIGKTQQSELSYHGEQGVENWKLRDDVYQNYHLIMMTVEWELQLACFDYHQQDKRLLHYETYCAFMETYRMCMNARDKSARPTETEETYLLLVVDDIMWTHVCGNMETRPDIDNSYLESQLNNTEWKGLIIKLAIYRRLNIARYQNCVSREGVYNALIDILKIVQSKYKSTRTHEQMDQDAKTYLNSELQKRAVAVHTPEIKKSDMSTLLMKLKNI